MLDKKKNNTFSLSARRIYRLNIISIIYSYELFDKKINLEEVFENYELSKKEIDALNFIKNMYGFFQKTIVNFLKKDWSWKTIHPLIRSILLLGSFELLFLDARIIINELVEITKDYTLESDPDYKFVNAILERISHTYEKLNKKNKNIENIEKNN